jgi:hypothetical protein
MLAWPWVLREWVLREGEQSGFLRGLKPDFTERMMSELKLRA